MYKILFFSKSFLRICNGCSQLILYLIFPQQIGPVICNNVKEWNSEEMQIISENQMLSNVSNIYTIKYQFVFFIGEQNLSKNHSKIMPKYSSDQVWFGLVF